MANAGRPKVVATTPIRSERDIHKGISRLHSGSLLKPRAKPQNFSCDD